jgi:hypothetical protein
MEANCTIKFRITDGVLDLVRVVSPTGRGITVKGRGIPASVATKVLRSGAVRFDARADLCGTRVYCIDWYEGTATLTYGEMRAVLAAEG